MSIEFHKMHGLGNDFVLIDNRGQNFQPREEKIRALANRHTGIGFDQLLLLDSSDEKDCLLGFRIFNADGSEAEQCGNGMRAIGLYLARRGEIDDSVACFGGGSGVVECQWLNGIGQARINMGRPRFETEAIPLLADLLQAREKACWQLTVADQPLRFSAVSMGNPHIVLLAEEHPGMNLTGVAELLTDHPAFPRGINIGWVEDYDRENIRLRVFERGSGLTRACGSGACAAMAALRLRNLCGPEVAVSQTGGKLLIEWAGRTTSDEAALWMRGPAEYVFKGELGE